MNTIMTPKFMSHIAKIIAEIRTKTYMDAVDAEVIEKILQDELNRAYDDGFDDGYDVGYGIGYDVGYDAGHSAVQ